MKEPELKILEYSKELQDYLEELRQVTSTLSTIDQQKQVLEKVVLLSMDEYWGLQDVIKSIQTLLEEQFHMVEGSAPLKVVDYMAESKYDPLKKQRNVVENFSLTVKAGDGFGIVVYDLEGSLGKTNDAEFLSHIHLLKEGGDGIFFIFCVQYMEQTKLEALAKNLEEVISLRVVSVPPVSMEHMVSYMKDKFVEANFTLTEGCDALLAQWIEQEEADGYFYGFDTLDKMVSELIYHKALQGNDFTAIQTEDITYWLKKEDDEDKDAYALLAELIGMTEIKERVKEIVAQVKLQKKLVEEGKDIDKPSMHMLFLGNPGTGKTTVARIIGQIFKQENLLSKGLFIEKKGSDFVKQYVGSSAMATQDICEKAHGSVLFIDEAYGMSIGTIKGDTTDEILPTMVAEMENYRDDLCVIFAGYKKEMEEFLERNSGLESRIPHILEFPNYSREELLEIFYHMINGKFEYEDMLKETLDAYIMGIPDAKLEEKEFSNARFVRNLYERLWGKAAYRMSFGEDKSMMLKKVDLDKVLEEDAFKAMMDAQGTKRIGFN